MSIRHYLIKEGGITAKTIVTALFFLTGLFFVTVIAVNGSEPDSLLLPKSTDTVTSENVDDADADKPVVFQPFSVFCDSKAQQNHYAPSGWMGDTQDLKFTGSYLKNPRLGKTCLKTTYLARGTKEWAGIYWQNPANNWGNVRGGYNLIGAKAVTFWAKGEIGGERISEFKIGGLSGKYPDSDVAWLGPVKLTREWKQYRIDLKGKDLRYINGGFCFTVLKAENPRGCTFYLDEIQYE